MKCTSCGDEPQTTGAIKGCRRCVKDGVANQISDAYPRDTPLGPIVARINGLENRFRGTDHPIEQRTAEVVPIKKSRVKEVVDAAVATVKRVAKGAA